MRAPDTLYYGENLRILRDYVASESVDLVYLDLSFNSNAVFKRAKCETSEMRAGMNL